MMNSMTRLTLISPAARIKKQPSTFAAKETYDCLVSASFNVLEETAFCHRFIFFTPSAKSVRFEVEVEVDMRSDSVLPEFLFLFFSVGNSFICRKREVHVGKSPSFEYYDYC